MVKGRRVILMILLVTSSNSQADIISSIVSSLLPGASVSASSRVDVSYRIDDSSVINFTVNSLGINAKSSRSVDVDYDYGYTDHTYYSSVPRYYSDENYYDVDTYSEELSYASAPRVEIIDEYYIIREEPTDEMTISTSETEVCSSSGCETVVTREINRFQRDLKYRDLIE